jgi:hypothetical protein
MAIGSLALDQLHAFEEIIREHVPGFKVAFKDESPYQRILGFLIRPFNAAYMTRFTTTFYPIVWFPSRAAYEENPKNSFGVLAHEFVHLMDTKRHPIWFRLSYVLPQIVSILPLALYQILVGMTLWVFGIFMVGISTGLFVARSSAFAAWIMFGLTVLGTLVYAFYASGWIALLLVLGFALLAPWPSTWRTYWELRGYAVQVSLAQWIYGTVPEEDKVHVTGNFTKSGYYFMSWNERHINRCLDEIIVSAKNRSILNEKPYDVIYSFAVTSGLIEAKS